LVSGLIELQLQNSENQNVQKELRKSHSRIYSMGKVHEQTYQHEDAADVKMDIYVESIVKQVESNFGEIDGTRFNLACASFKLTISQAVTFGLLLNELLTLICRHEFSHANNNTKITIRVEGNEKLVQTKFQGISKPFDIAVADSLDGTLIRKLTKQLNTELHRFQDQEQEVVNLEFTFDKKDSPSYFNSWEPAR